jgi:hypothetical protein
MRRLATAAGIGYWRRLHFEVRRSDLGPFGHFPAIVDFDPTVRVGALGLAMSKQQWNCTQVFTALRGLGHASKEQTGHGLRSMASTLLNEFHRM